MDNILFLGGIAAAALALILAGAYFVFYRLKAARLRLILEKEYGRQEKSAQRGEK